MSPDLIIGVIIAILVFVVAGLAWAYVHVKNFHTKIDALTARSNATPSAPPAPIVLSVPSPASAPAVAAVPVDHVGILQAAAKVVAAASSAASAAGNLNLTSYLSQITDADRASRDAAQAAAAAQTLDLYGKGYLKGIGDSIRQSGSGTFEVREVGPVKLEFGYTGASADPNVKNPTKAWVSVDGAPEVEMNVYSEGVLNVTGPCKVAYRSDTGGPFTVTLVLA